MGSITSRGDNWPPKPVKRIVVRNYVEVDENNLYRGGAVKTVEDYVWIYPGAEIRNGGGGVPANWCEETSPGQEIAIRALEDN